MPLVGDIWEGYKSSEFVLVVDAVESPSVTRISGLSEGSYDTIEQPDGGSHRVRKMSGSTLKWQTLSVVFRLDGSPDNQRFLDWWKETFDFAENASRGSRVRKNFQIIKKDNGVPVMTILVFNGWIKSSMIGDFEAGSDTLLTHTIEIEHEGLERVPA